jgi:hypothetical protein
MRLSLSLECFFGYNVKQLVARKRDWEENVIGNLRELIMEMILDFGPIGSVGPPRNGFSTFHRNPRSLQMQ